MFGINVWEDIIFVALRQGSSPTIRQLESAEKIVQVILTASVCCPDNYRDLMVSILNKCFTTATFESDEMIDAATTDMIMTFRKIELPSSEVQNFITECDFDKLVTNPNLELALLAKSEKIIDWITSKRNVENVGLPNFTGFPSSGHAIPPKLQSKIAKMNIKRRMLPLLVKLYKVNGYGIGLISAMTTSAFFYRLVYPLAKQTDFLKWHTDEQIVDTLRWLPIDEIDLFQEDAPMIVFLIEVVSMVQLAMPWNDKMNIMYRYLTGTTPDWFLSFMRFPIVTIAQHIATWIMTHNGQAKPESLLMIKTKLVLYRLWFVKLQSHNVAWWPLMNTYSAANKVCTALEMTFGGHEQNKNHYYFRDYLSDTPWPDELPVD